MITATRSARPSARSRDDGFTVVEVVVSIALVTIVMTSLAAYFVNSGRITEDQGRRQTAVHVALTAMDRARSLSGIGLTAGRSKNSTTAQWTSGRNAAEFPGVADYLNTDTSKTDLDTVAPAYDKSLADDSNAGADAPLPTTGTTVTLGNNKYKQDWFLAWCLRQNGKCTAATDPTAKNVYVRVVVAVTWAERGCANGKCSYVTSSLVSETQDPVFDQSQGAPKPRIVNPGDQTHQVSQPVNLPITMTGGTPAFTWTPPTLPDGLTWGTTSSQCPSSPAANPVCIFGEPTTATASGTPFKVTLKVTDSFDYVNTAVFYWTITPGPTLAAYLDQTNDTNDAVGLAASATSGTTPYTYSATGLPPGLSISSSTGKITGTPTLADSYPVTVTVIDKWGASDTKSFTWNVNVAGVFVSGACNPAPSGANSQTCTGTYTVYGDGPFTWRISRADTDTTIVVSADTKTARFTSTAPLRNHPTYLYRFNATQNKTGGVWLGGYSIQNA